MLYLVPTPIGNLEDITLRALRVLREADIIACEDTRNTIKLLNYYEITNKKLVSYHEHNEENSSEKIISYLEDNLNVALVTDAGMPCISDPGYILVKKIRDRSLEITALPGANAGLVALVASGIPSYNYTFYGFLPRKNKELREKITYILKQNTTGIIYESPYRISNLIEIISSLDEDRVITIARELTKMYEQIVTEKVCNIKRSLGDNIKEKGEFVVIISPNQEKTNEDQVDISNIIEIIHTKVQNGEKK